MKRACNLREPEVGRENKIMRTKIAMTIQQKRSNFLIVMQVTMNHTRLIYKQRLK